MTKGSRAAKRRSRRNQARSAAAAARTDNDEAHAIERFAALAAEVAGVPAPASSTSDLEAMYGVRLEAAVDACETAIAQVEALLDAGETTNVAISVGTADRTSNLFVTTEILIDHAAERSERALQIVFDQLHTRRLPKPVLARLAREILSQLLEIERATASTDAARSRVACELEKWVALLSRASPDDPSDAVRAVIEDRRRTLEALATIAFEQRSHHARLYELGRLVDCNAAS